VVAVVAVGRDPLAWALAALAVCACGAPERDHAIEIVREIEDPAIASVLGATSAERFGLALPGRAPGLTGAGAAPATLRAGPTLTWELPAGWHERSATAMRLANFGVDSDPRIECYLTLLAGDAGGLAANVDRWRAQLGLPAIGDAELAALERAELLGRPAVLLDARGTWTGMGDRAPEPDYRLLGLIACEPEGSAFLTLTGPAASVEPERAAFLALARSIRAGEQPAPPAGEGAAPVAAPLAATGAARAGGIAWTLPAGWSRAPDRATRLASFAAGAAGLDVSLTALAGDGGGARANLDRWRGQMREPPLTDDEFGALERFEMLGASARSIEIAGTFQDPAAGPLAGALLLGAVCETGSQALFVKLVGPAALVEAERGRFREFCSSLARER
jgi:hypothetical protein